MGGIELGVKSMEHWDLIHKKVIYLKNIELYKKKNTKLYASGNTNTTHARRNGIYLSQYSDGLLFLNFNSTTSEVAAWVRSIPDLSRYAVAFEENDIDGHAFSELDQEMGVELGVTLIEHWRIIYCQAINIRRRKEYMAKRIPFIHPRQSKPFLQPSDIERNSWSSMSLKLKELEFCSKFP